MPRKIRIEYPGALYHVINRGNYRSWIFKTAGARKSFLETLKECCSVMGWKLHAWCLMGNHYHLCIETPEANLVEGMRWLQSVFANRFNRFRKSSGHVFQGRYKAILLDGEALGAVCHYIHLNPVRAGIVECQELEKYRHSSFHQLWHQGKRWRFCDHSTALDWAGHLVDSPEGRRLYRDYLGWLSEEDQEQKRLGFVRMSRGWAKGSKEFKDRILSGLSEEKLDQVVEADAAGIRSHKWEREMPALLEALGVDLEDAKSGRKGEPWKVAAARYLREKYLAPYKWITRELSMGAVGSVQALVCRHRNAGKGAGDPWWEKLERFERGGALQDGNGE
jgi:putative transposase